MAVINISCPQCATGYKIDKAQRGKKTTCKKCGHKFCWPVRTLRVKVAKNKYEQRTPAMAAGLTDHIGTIKEWATYPAISPIGDPKCGSRARQDS